MRRTALTLALSTTLAVACSDGGAGDALDGGHASEGVVSPTDSAPPDNAADDAALPDAAPPDTALPDTAPPDSVSAPWAVPTCATIIGFSGVGFGPKEAKTVTSSTTPLPPHKTFTRGLVALDRPNTLLALHQTDLYRSENAGCNWKLVGTVVESDLRLVAGVGDRAWAYKSGSSLLYRVDGTTVTKLSEPLQLIKGLQPHATKVDTIRISGDSGAIYESTNAGATWVKIGSAGGSGSLYSIAFDPGDLDHIIVGRAKKGFYVTHDGGKTWKTSTGLASYPGGPVNGFNAVISPASGKVVWANAVDLSTSADPSMGRHIYHSADGGLTFSTAVTHKQQQDVLLTNGLHLVPHPARASRLYFTYGSCGGSYGVNLYRYDASHKTLSWDNHPFAGFGEITASPADPNFLYLALNGPHCP